MGYRTIMVPTDGSDFARQAMPLAAELARRSGARLELVCVHPGLPPGPSGRVPEELARADEELAREEREALEEVAAELRSPDVDVEAEMERGSVVEALCRRAGEDADLVVMATHGRGPLTRLWLGSTADGLIRRCSVPVLLVRPREGGGRRALPRHLVVPLDGSRLARAALDPAARLAEATGGRITLLRVVQPVMGPGFGPADFPQGVDAAATEAAEDEAAEKLGRAAAELRDRGLDVAVEVVRRPDVARAVLDAASGLEADATVMATHGRGGVRRLLLGSVADKVIRGSEDPVLVVHPGPEAGPEAG